MPEPTIAPPLPQSLPASKFQLTEAEISELRELFSKSLPSTESELTALVARWACSRLLKHALQALGIDPESSTLSSDVSEKLAHMKLHSGGMLTLNQPTTNYVNELGQHVILPMGSPEVVLHCGTPAPR